MKKVFFKEKEKIEEKNVFCHIFWGETSLGFFSKTSSFVAGAIL